MKAFLNFVLAAMMILQTGFLSMNPAAAQGEVTETPTPTQVPMEPAVETNTPEPGETPTPTPTALPTESSPTPTTVSPESPIVVDPEEITLSLTSDPAYLKRGGELYVEWSIGGMKEIAQGTNLRIFLPKGLTLIDPGIGKLSDTGDVLDIEIIDVIGKAGFMVGMEAETPLVITAELLVEEKSLAKASLSLLEPNETLVGSKGGMAAGLGGRVRVNFPEGALPETVKVSIERPLKEALPVRSLSGSPFEITAVSEAAKAEVSQFPGEVEIQVTYDEGELRGSEDDLRLFWYDPSDKQWKLPLSQFVDTENNVLHAYTDHFTVFDTYNSGWQSAETPTMEFFQHAGYTGAASFSMPIKVPAGPGGFQPSLALTYNSQVVDGATTDTQASWVGMGWSLDAAAYIERNGVGTIETGDDSFSLTLQGMGGALWLGTDGRYHLENENFAKITHNENADTWTVLDKQGNQYYFEEKVGYTSIKECPDGSTTETGFTWRWMLKRTVNIYGKEITYTYAQESQSHAWTDGQGCAAQAVHANAVYPSTILYANGRYRVRFQRTERYDYKPEWLTLYRSGVFKTFQKSLLANILIEQDSDGDGTFETLLRKYHFTYCNDQTCSIFPSLVWPSLQNYRTPTLTSVREYGLGGTNGLPAQTFLYEDGMHLTRATNGYGGTVVFTYKPWHQNIPYETLANGLTENELPRWGNPLKCTFQNSVCSWVGVGQQGLVGGGNGSYIRVTGVVEKAIDSYQPGRWYRIVAGIKRPANFPNGEIQFGYSYNDGTQHTIYQAAQTTTAGLRTLESGPFLLPRDTTSFKVRIKSHNADGSDGYNDLYWYYLVPLPTYSRVETRTLTTTSGNSYAFSYVYEGEATNIPSAPDTDLGNSNAAATEHPYTTAYSEFRGHQYVIETDPYGKQVRTEYGQTDCLSGKALSVETRDSGGILMQSSSNSYYWGIYECKETAPDPTSVPLDTEWPFVDVPYTGIMYRWSPIRDETSNVHDASGAIAAYTATHYNYNQTYGNLTSQSVSGTGIVTTTTHTEYYLNISSGLWLVGLPSRRWVTNAAGTLSETITLYEDADRPGVATGTRTLMKDAQYSQTSMTHDTYGNVTSQTVWTGYWTDPNTPLEGAQTSYTCYGSGETIGGKWCPNNAYHTYPLWTKNSKGHVTNVDYSGIAVPGTPYTGYSIGMPVSETDPNGAVTTASYDVFGRFKSLTKPGDAAPSLTVSYQNNPFIVTLNQAIDSTHSLNVMRYYDGLGRQTMTNTNGIMVDYGYDAYGRVRTQSMPHHSEEIVYNTVTTYDALGRPLTATAPDGTMTSYAYDGLTTTVTDGKGNKTTTETNILGWTLSVTPPTGPNVVYEYDDLGNMLTATRGGAIVTLAYDKAGRKTSMDDPDMGDWSYTYDALGNMLTQTDARGCITNIAYDVLNRPTGKTYTNCPDTPAVTYTYDAGTNGKGRRTSMEDGSGSTTWNYDGRGRVWKETKVIAGTSFDTEWTYNLADLPVRMTYPDNEIVTTQYNYNMQPINVAGTDNYVPSMTYDSAGRLLSRALGNGLTQTYHYYDWNEQVYINDSLVGQGGRLETLEAGTLQDLSYQYDTVGNITRIVNSVANETSQYGYDALNRLTSWTLNTTTETYGYDNGTGNLVNKNGLMLDYPAANGSEPVHPHAVTGAGTNTYGYDNNGNQTTRNVAGQSYALGYDAENRLVSVTGTNLSAQFTYNGDGQRVKSVINGETILFVGGYYEQKGSEITKYYMAGAGRIAVRKYAVPQYDNLYYMLGDHLGSTSITIDADTGGVVETRYKPWGEVRFTSANKTLPTRYTFTGQYSYMSDEATDLGNAGFGLIFYQSRFYDPLLGRFAQADSIVPGGVQGLDRYAYVGNSPVRYTDPSGHRCVDPETNETTECTHPSQNLKYERAAKIELKYHNISISNPSQWSLNELGTLNYSLLIAYLAFGSDSRSFLMAFGYVTFTIVLNGSLGVGSSGAEIVGLSHWNGTIELTDKAFSRGEWNIYHELGHIFDFKRKLAPSSGFTANFNTGFCLSTSGVCADRYFSIFGLKIPYQFYEPTGITTDYGATSSLEDFADSFAAYLSNKTDIIDALRLDLIDSWINGV